MGEHTKIEWCDHSLSPWWGCTKVSPGCAFCYAEGLDARWHGGRHWGKGSARMRQPNFERNALELDRKAAKRGHRVTVFPSMCDPFDAEVPAEWLAHFFDVVRRTPHLTWILLTKRPELWRDRLHAVIDGTLHLGYSNAFACDWLAGRRPPNLWLLTSTEDQERYDERVPELLRIPAHVHGVSMEPLLGEIDLKLATHRLQWVIVGGESGPQARPMHPEWPRAAQRQCAAAGVPFFFKQWGEWAPGVVADIPTSVSTKLMQPGSYVMTRMGKAEAGRELDGVEHSNFPDLTKLNPSAP